jgi:Zn-dependent protease
MTFARVFKRQIQVARVAGIPVRIDYRWFLIFALSVWVIAVSFEEGTSTARRIKVEQATAWVTGVLTTLGLFLSILLHELSHALVGRAEGIESEEIVLHPFGGLTRLRREPDNPRAEFRIAIAGPASSFIIGVLSFGAMSLATALNQLTVAAAFFIIGFWNLLLAVSNLLPGYPLDGGRVLRAFLWHKHGRLDEATRTASLGGQLIAGSMVVFGVYFYWKFGDAFMGLWLALVGVFLFDSARSVMRGRGGDGRHARTVSEAMTAPVSIEPDTLVSHFIDNVLPAHRQAAILVAKARRLHGILTLEDLKSLPRERWHVTRVGDVMRPVDRQFFVEPTTPLARAEQLMRENGAGALAVVDAGGELVGFLLRGRLRRRSKT